MTSTDTMTRPNSRAAALKADLAAIVGDAGVRDDAATLALFSEDIWSRGAAETSLVVAPRSLEDLARAVAAVDKAGFAIAPRGAGMSYTGGYLPSADDTVSLDLSAMDRIIAVRADDMTVTVEAGCTWKALNAALAPLGLRTPFWGPMSGFSSTIGGGISQLNAMLGAAQFGTSSESVVALTVVLADGQILRTGAGGDTPFYRHYGPDLAGIFCGDCGVFGIKAEITLRLIRARVHEDYASFSFGTGAELLAAMAEMSRASVASEMCAFDPGLTKVRMARASLMGDVKTLGAVVAKEKSLGKGLMAAAKIALGGRNFIDEGDYPLHVICDGRSAAGVAHDITEARRIAAANGGHEIENTIAKVIRSVPFPPLNSMLGPTGEAWAPVHGNVSLSNAPKLFAAITTLFGELAPTFAEHGISTGFLFSSLSTNALVVEPVFYWPQGWRPVHESAVEPSHLSRLTQRPPNPAATAVVANARRRVTEICARFGCGHFQVGRTYPYRASLDAASKALLDAIKAHLDPHNAMNPGSLGFPERPDD